MEELTDEDKEFIQERINNLRKYIDVSKEQIELYKTEISILEKVLKN